MKDLDILFFELIRVAIGTQETPSAELRASLSRLPSHSTGSGLTPAEWGELFDMAVKQSLVGVCFAGLQKLFGDDEDGNEAICISEMQYYTWLGAAAQVQQRNGILNRQCVELQARLAEAGIRSSILKGQGIAGLYGGELCELRQPGDIDVYVDCGRGKAIEYARSIQGKVDWDYKHLHLKVFEGPSTGSGTGPSTSSGTGASSGTGTEVEMHYRVEVSMNLIRNRKLQKWFESPEIQSMIFCDNDDFVSPSVEFNSFYILLHFYRHFLYEGVGMRQLMDYYYVLKNLKDVSFATKAIRKFKMEKFAGAVQWVLDTVFSDKELIRIAEPDEMEGIFLLNEIMKGGNFGHHDERLVPRCPSTPLDTSRHARGPRKIESVKKILKHNWHVMSHYPGEVLWAPVWIVYHWCWKKFQRV